MVEGTPAVVPLREAREDSGLASGATPGVGESVTRASSRSPAGEKSRSRDWPGTGRWQGLIALLGTLAVGDAVARVAQPVANRATQADQRDAIRNVRARRGDHDHGARVERVRRQHVPGTPVA